jgi:hypothetical protein
VSISRSIKTPIDTLYFRNVTPIWTSPKIRQCDLYREIEQLIYSPAEISLLLQTVEGRGQLKSAIRSALTKKGFSASRMSEIWIEEIDSRYHEAAKELAKWQPPVADWDSESWAKHPDNIFFRLRERLMDCCEGWHSYNWDKMAVEVKRVGEITTARKKLIEASNDLSRLLSKYKPLNEPYALLAKNEQSKIDRARYIEGFEWKVTPKRLVSPETMIGICLADIVSRFVIDPSGGGTLHLPVAPLLANQIPWKALQRFVQTCGLSDESDGNSLRSIVVNAHKNISNFYGSPTCRN